MRRSFRRAAPAAVPRARSVVMIVEAASFAFDPSCNAPSARPPEDRISRPLLSRATRFFVLLPGRLPEFLDHFVVVRTILDARVFRGKADGRHVGGGASREVGQAHSAAMVHGHAAVVDQREAQLANVT